MPRVFTCVWLPDELKARVVEIQEQLKKIVEAKFVEPENLHLTLTFLGNISEERLISVKRTLDSVLKNVKSFHVKLEGLKIIPNERFIRVIGISVTDDSEISRLIKVIGTAIDGKYHEKTKLTLCRVKNVSNRKSLMDFIEKNRHIKIGRFHVKTVALVKSTLTRRGPLYETIHSFPLE